MRYNKQNKRRNFKQEQQPQGLTVIVRDGDVNKAMRILKKKLLNDGFFQELRDRTFYESRGTKRRKARRLQQDVLKGTWKNVKKSLDTK